MFHLGHVSGSGENQRFKYSAAQVGFMQKIAEQNSEEGQSMNTEGVSTITRIPLTRAQAAQYMSNVLTAACVREYEHGNTHARTHMTVARV